MLNKPLAGASKDQLCLLFETGVIIFFKQFLSPFFLSYFVLLDVYQRKHLSPFFNFGGPIRWDFVYPAGRSLWPVFVNVPLAVPLTSHIF